MSTKHILSAIKAAQSQIDMIGDLDEVMKKEVLKLPAEAQKVYNDNIPKVLQAIKDGDMSTAGTLATQAQEKMNNIAQAQPKTPTDGN